MHAEAAPSGPELSRLRWQCRRGMRELDELLLRYLGNGYCGASAAEKQAFSELLRLPDPELFGYLVGREQVHDEVQHRVLAQLRAAGRVAVHDPR